MKKKIALLLAAVMTFAVAVPMNLFAAPITVSSLSTTVAAEATGMGFAQDGLQANLATVTATGATVAMFPEANASGAFVKKYAGGNATAGAAYNLKYLNDAVNLTVDFGIAPTAGSMVKSFRISLDNSVWAFLISNAGSMGTYGSSFYQGRDTGAGAADNAFFVPNYAVTSTNDAKIFAESAFGVTSANKFDDGLVAPFASTAALGDTEVRALYYSVSGTSANNQNEFVLFKESDTTAVIFFVPQRTTRLVIPLSLISTNDKATLVNVYDGDSGLVNNQQLSFAGGGAGTTAKMDGATGRDYVDLNTIVITDKLPGAMRATIGGAGTNNFIELQVPEGYRLVYTSTTNLLDVSINGIAIVGGGKATLVAQTDATKFRIILPEGKAGTAINDFQFAHNVINTLRISGIRLEPVDRYDIDYNVDIPVKIVNDSLRITDETIVTSPQFITWNIDMSISEVVTIPAGRANQGLKAVTLKELAPNSWWTERFTQYSLVNADGSPIDGVLISSVYVEKANFLKDGGTGNSKGTYYPFANARGIIETVASMGKDDTGVWNGLVKDARDAIIIDQDMKGFRLVEASPNPAKKVSVITTLTLTTDVMFEGEVWLKAENVSFGLENDYVKGNPILIANVAKQIDVTAENTKVELGVQKISVKDVTVAELVNGGLRTGSFNFTIGEFGVLPTTLIANLLFVPFASSTGNLKVEGADKTFKHGVMINTAGAIIVPITSATKDSKVSLTVMNLAIQVDRNAPEGFYDLQVDGTSIRNNGPENLAIGGSGTANTQFNAAYFTKGFILENYIHVATTQSNIMNKNNVKITAGSEYAEVNGVSELMNYAAFYEAGALYVPVRFVSVALGLQSKDIDWNNDAQVVTLMFAEKTIQFQVGSKYYSVAGETFPRLNDSGAVTKMFMIDGGGVVMIPFRSLGNALGMDVDSDTSTGDIVGIYNPIR